MNYGPLSVKTLDGVPKLAIQSWLKLVITVVAVVFVVGLILVSFENLSVTTKMNRLPVFVFDRGWAMSMATNANVPTSGNRRSLHCVLVV